MDLTIFLHFLGPNVRVTTLFVLMGSDSITFLCSDERFSCSPTQVILSWFCLIVLMNRFHFFFDAKISCGRYHEARVSCFPRAQWGKCLVSGVVKRFPDSSRTLLHVSLPYDTFVDLKLQVQAWNISRVWTPFKNYGNKIFFLKFPGKATYPHL